MEQHLIICPECGEGYCMSPMTLKIHCHNCGSLIFHRGLAGIIDWQAMAVETYSARQSRRLHVNGDNNASAHRYSEIANIPTREVL